MVNIWPYFVFQVIKRLLERSLPACPKLNFAIVDVRDVAAAHIKAMTVPEAAGTSVCLFICLLLVSRFGLAVRC